MLVWSFTCTVVSLSVSITVASLSLTQHNSNHWKLLRQIESWGGGTEYSSSWMIKAYSLKCFRKSCPLGWWAGVTFSLTVNYPGYFLSTSDLIVLIHDHGNASHLIKRHIILWDVASFVDTTTQLTQKLQVVNSFDFPMLRSKIPIQLFLQCKIFPCPWNINLAPLDPSQTGVSHFGTFL